MVKVMENPMKWIHLGGVPPFLENTQMLIHFPTPWVWDLVTINFQWSPKKGAFLKGHAMFQASIFKGGTNNGTTKTLPHYTGVMKKTTYSLYLVIKPNAINADVYGNVEGSSPN